VVVAKHMCRQSAQEGKSETEDGFSHVFKVPS